MESPKRAKIIAVDDESLNLYLLSEILNGHYDLTTARSALECLEILETIRPDLMLLDVNMPGMNGYELCAKIKTMPDFKNVPILFLSAMSFVENELKGLSAGAVDYLIKPFSTPILLSRINTHLQLKQVTQALKTEQSRVGDIVKKMADDSRFYHQNIEVFLNSLEATCGDVVFSGCTADQRQLVLVGDFTGHGLAAAVCGSVVSTLFYTQLAHGLTGGDLLNSLNQELVEKLPAYMFMVGALLELDLTTHRLKVWNFGLPKVFHFRHKQLLDVCASQSLPLGISADLRFDLPFYEAKLSIQDQVFVYTDGLTEMKNLQNKMYEDSGLQQFLEHDYQPEFPINIQLAAMVERYSQGRAFVDDMTLLSLRV